jgi:hypothetical protein
VTGGPAPGRFFIAPSDDRRPGESPLQCGLLGAFGGFFERSYRAHDYQLGRRNCQRFLQTSFLFPETRQAIIPLAGSAREEVPHPELGRISRESLREIVGLIAARANALVPLMTTRKTIRLGVRMLLAIWGKRRLERYLEEALVKYLH